MSSRLLMRAIMVVGGGTILTFLFAAIFSWMVVVPLAIAGSYVVGRVTPNDQPKQITQ